MMGDWELLIGKAQEARQRLSTYERVEYDLKMDLMLYGACVVKRDEKGNKVRVPVSEWSFYPPKRPDFDERETD